MTVCQVLLTQNPIFLKDFLNIFDKIDVNGHISAMKNLPNIGDFVKEKAVQTITNKVSQPNENNDNGGNTKAIFSSFFDILTGKKNSGEISESANEQTQNYINSENQKEQISVLRRIERNTTDIASAIRELKQANAMGGNSSNNNDKKDDDGIISKLIGGIGGLTAGVFALSALPGLVAPDETKEETSLLKNAPTILKGAEVATDIATTTNTLSNVANTSNAISTASTVANVANTTTNSTSTMSTLSKVGETLGSFSSAISDNKWFKTIVRGTSAGAIGGRLLDGDTTGAGLEATSYGLWEASNHVTNPKAKLGLATASLLTDVGIIGRDWLNKDDKEKEQQSQTTNNVENISNENNPTIIKSNDNRSFSNEYNSPTSNITNEDYTSNNFSDNQSTFNDINNQSTLVRNTSSDIFSDNQSTFNENVGGDIVTPPTNSESSSSETVANVMKIGGGLMGMTGVGLMARGLMKSKATSTAVGAVGNVASSALKSGAGGAVAGTLVKGGGKMVGKAIPLLGLGLGAYGAYTRAKDGDYLGAGLETLSGLASTVPVIGTGASLAIQGGLLTRDAYKAYNNTENNESTIVKENVSNDNSLKQLTVNDNLSQGIFNEKNSSFEKTQNSALQTNTSNITSNTKDDITTANNFYNAQSNPLQNGMNNDSKETNNYQYLTDDVTQNTLEKNYTSSALNTSVYNTLTSSNSIGDGLTKNIDGSLGEQTNTFIKDETQNKSLMNDIGYTLDKNITTNISSADWNKNSSVQLSPNHEERQKIDGFVTKVNHQYQSINNQDKAMQAQNIQSAQSAIQTSNPSVIPSAKNGGGGVDVGIVTRNPDSIFREVSISIMRRSMT